ncbi:MAG: hypothetical protein A2057_15260 [Ignavibacteria bacterium GWA2_35_9]|nr:MAG: hypothetical protein A2057_15260 [Ignavibacteria bacterium GWA2_35_9]OGU47235.1 MAG: hypothetical protein A2000_00880 [Ignavibacteria bacterium GWB2_36_8]OGU50117.1 MAG: hypothetical protein A2080_11855 [Ignavibacteria bacterium GWC2_36_12]
MKRSLLLLLLTSVLTLLFSCDETEKEKVPEKESKIIKEPAKAIDACSILDKSDIEKIFNTKMKEPKEGRSQEGGINNISFSECSFESDTEGSKIYLSIYIRFSPFNSDAYSTMRSVHNSFKQSGIETYNVDGVGDVAFWGGNQLHVFFDEDYYFIITLLGLRDQYAAIEKSKIVALKIAENIK